MDTAIIVALIVSIPPTVVGVINFFQGKSIHVLVNSNLTEVKANLATANIRIRELQDTIMKQAKDL